MLHRSAVSANLLKIRPLIITGIILLLPLLRTETCQENSKKHNRLNHQKKIHRVSYLKEVLKPNRKSITPSMPLFNLITKKTVAHKDKWHIGVSALRKLTERGDSVIKRVLQPESHRNSNSTMLFITSVPVTTPKVKTYPSIHEIIDL